MFLYPIIELREFYFHIGPLYRAYNIFFMSCPDLGKYCPVYEILSSFYELHLNCKFGFL